MKKRYHTELSAKELATLPDEAIDTSDSPELGEEFWKNARIAAVLPSFYEANQKAGRLATGW